MSQVLLDMQARLSDQGVLTTVALARLPDAPDSILALREYGAERSVDFTGSGLPVLERFAVQLVARASKDAGADAAEALAWEAYRALVGKHIEVTRGSLVNRYDWVYANAVPHHAGYDQNDRPLVIVNFSLQRWGDVT